MEITNSLIDNGKAFDWGKTSKNYGRYRDIYPDEFYRMLTDRGLCVTGQEVLDVGTGTGVLPRNLYENGAHFTAADISPCQIEEAKRLSAGKNINYLVSEAEYLKFPPESFDVITACQCFFYFDKSVVMPEFASLLKAHGKLVILYLGWLPWEDSIIKASQDLVLKYNPSWSGYGEKRHKIDVPSEAEGLFKLNEQLLYDVDIPFTRETWNGRMMACRGVEASLTKEETASFEREHIELLRHIAPEKFSLKHFVAMTVFEKI